MFDPIRRFLLIAAGAALAATAAFATQPPNLQESSFWAHEVERGDLPPIAERLPSEPLVVDLASRGRTPGVQGGTLRTLVSRSKDIRQMVVYGYARLVGYNHLYELQPDILASYDNVDDRKFTLRLRPGHKWSDGSPFTSADFEYWWKDVANNKLLSPAGPPDVLRVEGQLPTVTFPDETTVIYEWDHPNPNFIASLAMARPPFIYRPSTFLKQFHGDYADPAKLEEMIEETRVRSWAALHNNLDNMYKFDNHELPTLQPWMNSTSGKKVRHLFVKNPYYHRIDPNGVQLPYIDVVEMEIVSPGLIAAKSNAGETDLQARGLDFRDISILRKGEADGGNYRTLMWGNAVASQIAIYPNLNYNDDGWRAVLRDVRVRRALSLAIDRDTINKALFFNLAKPGAMTVLPASPFFRQEHRDAWASLDPDQANALLDEAGLDKRGPDGIRLLPDGRPMEIVIETAGERQEVENAIQIITDDWRQVGVKLVMRPLDRDILRNRIFSGNTMAGVWYGWDNGIPRPYTSPEYVAPRQQEFFAWPKWGQYYQTNGAAGEPPDMPEAIRLMELAHDWDVATTMDQRTAAWNEMLAIHADQIYAIGTLAEAPQPVVVNKALRNVPETGLWAWDPGAHFGIHRMDEFFFDPDGTR
ncbi:ABC transporter substrate-binding protein [Sedimentitalea sp. JM2-8]|uniref:ABC transporter substrate-binding protein n=1 Tax=Sedimentitalea xiamensis TaxID=3050037 RepID=A0ABT7FI12_9RHOB|nr:ABC transporter substrate-binding protein [Sedimentitalea xiamensis]MDK3074767.1 ABC transporter substrate-binding protein [Sedimentitalea xiamensis]